MGSSICEKGTLTSLDKSHIVRKIVKTYSNMAPDGSSRRPGVDINNILTKFKDLEERQGFGEQEPNWPLEITRTPAANTCRPFTHHSLRNITGFLGGDYYYQDESKNQVIPIIGLGNQRPLPFITENHHVLTSEKYTIILIWEEWRQNFMRVKKDLTKNLQVRDYFILIIVHHYTK